MIVSDLHALLTRKGLIGRPIENRTAYYHGGNYGVSIFNVKRKLIAIKDLLPL